MPVPVLALCLPADGTKVHLNTLDSAMSLSQNQPAMREDPDLLSALHAGDRAVQERVLSENMGQLFAVARRITGNDADAEDAVQTGLLSAFRSLSQFDGRSRLSTWLYRIVTNAAILISRKQIRRNEISVESLLPRYLEDGHRVVAVENERSSPVDAADQVELSRMLKREVDRLPAIYREVVVLRDMEQLSTEDVAEILGVSSSVVKTRLHRAHQALRQLLENEMVARGDVQS